MQYLVVVSVLLASSFGLQPQNAYSTNATYPLICRGGAMEFQYISEDQILTMKFRRGEWAAAEGVLPGTCSWLDRGINENEPSRICQDPVNFTMGWNAETRQINFLWPRGGEYMTILESPDNTVIFQVVANSETDCMVVKKVGL